MWICRQSTPQDDESRNCCKVAGFATSVAPTKRTITAKLWASRLAPLLHNHRSGRPPTVRRPCSCRSDASREARTISIAATPTIRIRRCGFVDDQHRKMTNREAAAKLRASRLASLLQKHHHWEGASFAASAAPTRTIIAARSLASRLAPPFGCRNRAPRHPKTQPPVSRQNFFRYSRACGISACRFWMRVPGLGCVEENSGGA